MKAIDNTGSTPPNVRGYFEADDTGRHGGGSKRSWHGPITTMISTIVSERPTSQINIHLSNHPYLAWQCLAAISTVFNSYASKDSRILPSRDGQGGNP